MSRAADCVFLGWRRLWTRVERQGRSTYRICLLWPTVILGLFFVPHLDGRVLPSAPSLRGAFVGLQFRHERRHLARAVLEAIAFEYAIYLATMRNLYPEISWTDVRVVGGGSRSAVWNQIKADVLGLPLSPVATKEPACWGAALLAARGAGLCADLSAHVGPAQLADTVTPDPQRHAQYGEMVGRYHRTVQALVELANGLGSQTSERTTGT